ncbi:Phosphoglucomutase-3, partial [Ascosphaera atra]
YLGNGAQLNTPADKEITQRIDDNLEPWASAWNDPKESELYTVDMSATVKEAYISKVKSYVESFGFGDIKAVPFVYTPMHGVGYRYFNQLCDEFKIKDWAVVEEQKEPDPDFPTVSFPNPEEHGALDLAMETADRLGRNLILANDPDADRFAVAEKVGGKWHRFSGDQVGVLLASYLLESFIELRRDRKKTAVLTTAVSSAMLHKMADSYGLLFEETLTGFKWLAKETQRLEKQGYSVPFAYEEALGYMFPAVSYDKDGLLAAMVFLAAATKWRKDGSTPASKLEQLYDLYGYHQTLNTYFVSPDKDTTNQLFARIRERPPHARNMIASFPVVRARDMTKGFDSGTMDGVP